MRPNNIASDIQMIQYAWYQQNKKVVNQIDAGDPVDVIYLDFQKAFDKVPHRRLLQKLRAYGIAGSITNSIENWLVTENREL